MRDLTTELIPIRNGHLRLHIRRWHGVKRPFVLLHGLSSNLRTWEMVAAHLAEAGHAVVSVDQRGHGQSDKPDDGYDFTTIGDDLRALLDDLGLQTPVVAGQSWGGNVVLDFAARYPGRAWGFAFVDGGVIDLQANGEGDWQTTSTTLRPPDLAGTPAADLERYIEQHHPDWGPQGVAVTMANFERLPDGTVRPWLSLDRHMRILRAMWEQRPGDLYARVHEPVLICAADDGSDSTWIAAKHRMVATAQSTLPHSAVVWFDKTDHDIHVHRPRALADLFLRELQSGIWSDAQHGEAAP